MQVQLAVLHSSSSCILREIFYTWKLLVINGHKRNRQFLVINVWPTMRRCCDFESLLEFLIPVRNEVAKVMFSRACVCPQGGLPQCMLGYPPGPDTHPLGPDPPPRDQTPPPREAATAADGTHPTGMHSCLGNNFWRLIHNNRHRPNTGNHSEMFKWVKLPSG